MLGQMQLHPRLSRESIELVKRFEGLRLKAARLADGGWTIGYGHTASAREGATVTPHEAEALLFYDLTKVAAAVDDAVLTPLNANQFAALTAFAFNIGVDRFRGSEVLKRLNEGDYLRTAAALELWRRADFQGDSLVVDALVRRRAAEKALFLTPPEGFRPVPTAVVRPQFDPALSDLYPLQPGLGGAADLRTSMDGETAAAKLQAEPPPFEPPTAAAARKVSERLNSLFPDEPSPAPREVSPPEDVAPDAAAVAEAPASPPAAAEPEPPPALQAASVEVDGAEPPSLFSAPPPRLHPSPPRWSDSAQGDQVETGGPFGRRYPTLAERAAAAQPPIHPPSPSQNLMILVLGVFGAVMFCAALATMVFGRATMVNLILGLLGVVCMAPCGLRLLTQMLGERPTDSTDPP